MQSAHRGSRGHQGHAGSQQRQLPVMAALRGGATLLRLLQRQEPAVRARCHAHPIPAGSRPHTHERGGSSKHLRPRTRRRLRLLLSPDSPSCSRLLQVMKIEYVNKKPTYSRVVVSVVDHVECRCQAATRAPVPKKKSPHKHHGHQHRNETLSQEHSHEQVQCECCFLCLLAMHLT